MMTAIVRLIEHYNPKVRKPIENPKGFARKLYEAFHAHPRRRTAWEVLEQVSDAIEGFGVEVICDHAGRAVGYYVNVGDVHTYTLVHTVGSSDFHDSTMGDWVESYERRHGRLP